MAASGASMTGEEFLSWLFGGTRGKLVVKRITPPPASRVKVFSTLLPDVALPRTDAGGNWYFGAVSRQPNDSSHKLVLEAPAIWVDIDDEDELPGPLDFAAPQVIVRTGHGFHAYWKLDQPADPKTIKPLLQLAATVLDADPNCAETARLLRIPDTLNVKGEPVMCEVVFSDTSRTYSVEEVTDLLLGALVVQEYEEGSRNELVMGFSATMARNGVSEERTAEIVSRVCAGTGDKEKRTRLAAVQATFDRHRRGEAVSTRGLADMVGAKYTALLKFLGGGEAGGDVMLDDEVVGSEETIQQDLVNLMTGSRCRWEYSEGQPVVWNERQWTLVEPRTISYQVFQVMDRLTTVSRKTGETRRLPAKTGVAEGVAKMVIGKLAATPMEPHDPNLLGLENGTLNLSTGEFRPCRKADRMKKLMPVEYDEKAGAETWGRFLDEAAPDSARFLQEFLGYCLRPGNPHERMAWAYGPNNTGKSTFLVTVFRLFGPLVASMSSQNISQYDIAVMEDTRIAICTELTRARLRTGLFKAMVSGDPVKARHPYGRPFTVSFQGKFLWASNALPMLDELEGVARRIVLVPFERRPKKPDVELKHKLTAELPGILNWAHEGLARLDALARKRKPWEIPASSRTMNQLYGDYQDGMAMFMADRLELGPGAKAPLLEVFQEYREFVRGMGGEFVEMGAWFPEELRRRGLGVEDMQVVGARVRGQSNLSWGIDRRASERENKKNG